MSHLSIAHAIPREGFVAKINCACGVRQKCNNRSLVSACGVCRLSGGVYGIIRLNVRLTRGSTGDAVFGTW